MRCKSPRWGALLPVLRGAIGFVPQEPFLFSDTVGQNIAFGLHPGGGNGAGNDTPGHGPVLADQIAQVRRFHRLVTQRAGALDELRLHGGRVRQAGARCPGPAHDRPIQVQHRERVAGVVTERRAHHEEAGCRRHA